MVEWLGASEVQGTAIYSDAIMHQRVCWLSMLLLQFFNMALAFSSPFFSLLCSLGGSSPSNSELSIADDLPLRLCIFFSLAPFVIHHTTEKCLPFEHFPGGMSIVTVTCLMVGSWFTWSPHLEPLFTVTVAEVQADNEISSSKSDRVLCFYYSYLRIANDMYHIHVCTMNIRTTNVPMPSALCLGTQVLRQKNLSKL